MFNEKKKKITQSLNDMYKKNEKFNEKNNN